MNLIILVELKRERFHHIVFYISLLLLVASLPLSLFMVSVTMFALAVNWLVEGNFREKFRILSKKRSVWLLISVYGLFLAGMVYSKNLSFGLHDLRIKLPMLLMPIVLATSKPLNMLQFKWAVYTFVLAVFAGSLVGIFLLLEIGGHDILDSRQLSPFVSHIRFSLMIVLAAYLLLYLLFFKPFSTALWERVAILLLAIWLATYLFILNAFTGIVIVYFLLPFFFLRVLARYRQPGWAAALGIVLAILFGYLLFITVKAYNNTFRIKDAEVNQLFELTASGNAYKHYPNNHLTENGYYVWRNIFEPEMRQEWNKRSNFKYDSLDKKGFLLNQTLTRYLTSLGLTKDSAGVARLTARDIENVEDSQANYLYGRNIGAYPRVYQILWEINTCMHSDFCDGSVYLRYIYVKNTLKVISRHLVFGVGTGDVRDKIQREYELSNSPLPMELRLRTHNQLLTFILAFGLLGFGWIVTAHIWAFRSEKMFKSLLFNIFFLISLLSMFNEDTLETHTGVSFFAVFLSFFLYSVPKYFLDQGNETS